MNDFTILHLSDLHINRKGNKLSILHENLLCDIESEMRVSENIMLSKRKVKSKNSTSNIGNT